MKVTRVLRASLMAQAALLLLVLLIRNVAGGGFSWAGLYDSGAINTTATLHTHANVLVQRLAGGESGASLASVIETLDLKLHERELAQALERPGREVMRASYHALLQRWDGGLRAALLRGDAPGLRASAEHFERDLDLLVGELQNEHNRLHALELGLVALMVVLLPLMYLLTCYLFQRRITEPLRELAAATEQLQSANYDVRVPLSVEDEIGRLATAFNNMAQAVGESHRSLEQDVDAKMRQLAQANATLELLFRTSRRVAESPLDAAALEELVSRFQELMPALQISLCLEPGVAGRLIAVHSDAGRETCSRSECSACPRQLAEDQQVYEVRSQGQALGKLRVHFPQGRAAQPWEDELLQALVNLVGSALVLGQQREQNNQMLLLGERSTIARELHDSLAQALSYLNMQVSCIQLLIQEQRDYAALGKASEELSVGISDAYRQLRELLTTFRLGFGGGDLTVALREIAEEFSQRGGFAVVLDVEPLAAPLTANEQIDLVQIVREALANCLRHANAERVRVSLRQRDDDVELLVDDDGTGISTLDTQRHRHGITIMQERAGNIGGRLEVIDLQPRGTRVRLEFRPSFFPEPAGEAAP